jgi:hypothetical protein
MSTDQEFSPESQIQKALIEFVDSGAAPSVDILRAFLRGNRLDIVRGLGNAGLSIPMTNNAAIERLQRLSAIANAQRLKGPFDDHFYEREFFKHDPATPDVKAPEGSWTIDDFLQHLEDGGSFQE